MASIQQSSSKGKEPKEDGAGDDPSGQLTKAKTTFSPTFLLDQPWNPVNTPTHNVQTAAKGKKRREPSPYSDTPSVPRARKAKRKEASSSKAPNFNANGDWDDHIVLFPVQEAYSSKTKKVQSKPPTAKVPKAAPKSKKIAKNETSATVSDPVSAREASRRAEAARESSAVPADSQPYKARKATPKSKKVAKQETSATVPDPRATDGASHKAREGEQPTNQMFLIKVMVPRRWR